ncbi:hypothetical protein D9M72_522800 [compost metagenome]
MVTYGTGGTRHATSVCGRWCMSLLPRTKTRAARTATRPADAGAYRPHESHWLAVGAAQPALARHHPRARLGALMGAPWRAGAAVLRAEIERESARLALVEQPLVALRAIGPRVPGC